MRSLLFTFVCATTFLWSVSAGLGQEAGLDRVSWHLPRISTRLQQSNVREVLKEFAASQQLAISISDSVQGVVSGVFEDVDAQRFLNSICESNNLVWFYDGVRLHIESAAEITSRPVSLSHTSPEAIADATFSLGYASGPRGRQVQIKSRYRPGLILLVGGPQFVQATELLARDLDTQEARRQVEEITVRTFRLSYASASDISLSTGSTNRVIPGVVRTLQNLMSNQQASGSLSTGAEDTAVRRTHQSLFGQGLAAVGNPDPTRPRGGYVVAPDGSGPRPVAGANQPEVAKPLDPRDPRAPMIVADVRLNAVIVRDVAARMPVYEDLIRMLDVPTKSIEISAAVVDIDSNNGKDIGLEILGFGKKGNSLFRGGFNADRGLFDQTDTQGQTPSFVDSANLARGAGLNVTALLAASGYEILGRLRAIERAGAGQVLSSPSVLTMENVQAIIRTDEKIYVKVPGSYATDLFDVTTGVQLRVTPTIIRRGSNKEFKLDIEIVDGSFSDTKVDTIPTTLESAITTQAMVPESRTLLLGGYTVERRTRVEGKVPYVSKIPLIGKLFTQNTSNHERRQRFFLITPRLVDVHKEATYPEDYVTPFAPPIELPPVLPDTDLTREDPEELARTLAATTAKAETATITEVTTSTAMTVKPASTPQPVKVLEGKQTQKPQAAPSSTQISKKPQFRTSATRLNLDNH